MDSKLVVSLKRVLLGLTDLSFLGFQEYIWGWHSAPNLTVPNLPANMVCIVLHIVKVFFNKAFLFVRFICLWYQDHIRVINWTRSLMYRSALWPSVMNLFCISFLKCWSPHLQNHSGPGAFDICSGLHSVTEETLVRAESERKQFISVYRSWLIMERSQGRLKAGAWSGTVEEHRSLLVPGSCSSPFLYCPGVTPPTVVQAGSSHTINN